MNNGDKVRQMTNEELVKWKGTSCNELLNYNVEPCAGQTLDRCFSCKFMLNYLNTEVEKTADEMFKEIGFDLDEENDSCLIYSDAFGRTFELTRHIRARYKLCTGSLKIWTDDTIDQIRTIAQKKRRELGWV